MLLATYFFATKVQNFINALNLWQNKLKIDVFLDHHY